jgi:hypothetical protein
MLSSYVLWQRRRARHRVEDPTLMTALLSMPSAERAARIDMLLKENRKPQPD